MTGNEIVCPVVPKEFVKGKFKFVIEIMKETATRLRVSDIKDYVVSHSCRIKDRVRLVI